MPSAYDRAKDKKTADHISNDRELMCRADGCPNVWTVDSDDLGIHRLCSAHAWVKDKKLWPIITQEQVDAETDRALNAMRPKKPAKVVSRDELRTQIRSLDLAKNLDRSWARRLKAADDAGLPITESQRAAYKAALGHDTGSTPVVMGEMSPIPNELLPKSMRRSDGGDPTFPMERL